MKNETVRDREGSYDPCNITHEKHIYNYGLCGNIYMSKSGAIMFFCADCEFASSNLEKYYNHLEKHWQEFEGTNALNKAFREEYIDIKNEPDGNEENLISESFTIEPLLQHNIEIESENLISNDANNFVDLDEENIKSDENEINELYNQEYEPKLNDNIAKEDDIENCNNYPITEAKESDDESTELFIHNLPVQKQKSIVHCKICNRKFSNGSRLKMHEKVHSSERNFKCEFCGFSFKEDFNLRAHIRRHFGNKRFKCDHCTKLFHTKSEQIRHERCHTGERPYVCDSCGQSFSSTGGLHEHRKRHKNLRPHTCETCKKTFFDTHQLREHEFVHKDERNFICTICYSTFKRSKTLKAHFKLHENKREYACEICQAAFNQKPALIMHMKNKHRVLPPVKK